MAKYTGSRLLDEPEALAYARRALELRMLAVKNST
jgi:hypothetical protein